MDREHRRILKDKRDILTRNINFDDLIKFLEEYKIFNKYMWKDVMSTSDLFDALPFRGPKAFQNIIEILRKAKYNAEADILENRTLSKETPDYNMFYKMSSKPLGFCLIINNVEFDKLSSEDKDREGSDVDAESLCNFFQSIHFDVTVERNKRASQMIACLKEFSDRDFAYVDSLIIIIMSHGGQRNNKDFIYGTDWKYIYKFDICDIFSNKSCEQLQNKPKMFFFICCRGHDKDYGVLKCLPRESVDSSSGIIMPSLSDIFVVHSTMPQQVSVRHHDDGSYFCKAFITVLKEHYQTHDLETMIKLVNENLQKKVSDEYCNIQATHMENLGGTKKVMLCQT